MNVMPWSFFGGAHMSKRLTHREPEQEIDGELDAKLRKLAENDNEKIAQPP